MGVRTARVSRVGPAEGKAPPSDQRSPILISVFQNLISQASFAPSVGFANVFLEDNPHVNTYMWNVIGALPFGEDRQFRPYISAGLGAITLHTTVFTSVKAVDTTSASDSRLGSNIGGGLMVFAGRVGVRADVRHYSATTSSDAVLTKGESPSDLTRALLSGLEFWRTDVGVAFRW